MVQDLLKISHIPFDPCPPTLGAAGRGRRARVADEPSCPHRAMRPRSAVISAYPVPPISVPHEGMWMCPATNKPRRIGPMAPQPPQPAPPPGSLPPAPTCAGARQPCPSPTTHMRIVARVSCYQLPRKHVWPQQSPPCAMLAAQETRHASSALVSSQKTRHRQGPRSSAPLPAYMRSRRHQRERRPRSRKDWVRLSPCLSHWPLLRVSSLAWRAVPWTHLRR